MKRLSRSMDKNPTVMIHHIREIQLRLLAIVAVSLGGMAVGYLFYEPLFAFIKAPLDGPLHYMSPAGSFTFIIKICMMVGVIVALPVAVYNVIMFIQPALARRLSRLRVYLTTLASLLLAGSGAAFGYFIILPLALRFFYKFQVEGLEAIIAADEYLRFVIGVIITFVLIFQLPLLMSLADHIRPLPPRKLLKAEKYIVVGSIFIGVIVPFALDPTVQLLIASPIIVLYNLSIVIVLWQQFVRRRAPSKKELQSPATPPEKDFSTAPEPTSQSAPMPIQAAVPTAHRPPVTAAPTPLRRRSIDGTLGGRRPAAPVRPQPRPTARIAVPRRRGLVMDIHPISASRSAPPSPAPN